jgi:hypothetical protein
MRRPAIPTACSLAPVVLACIRNPRPSSHLRPEAPTFALFAYCSVAHTMSGIERIYIRCRCLSATELERPLPGDTCHKNGFTCTNETCARNQINCATLSGAMTESKEALLKQVDGLLDLARRSRRLSPSLSQESDRQRLDRHAEELEESASRIEGEAASAKTMNVARAAGLKALDNC